MILNNNVKLVQNIWKQSTKNVDIAARAARDEMMNSLIQLSKEQIKGARRYTEGPRGGRVYEKAWKGFPTPPQNRTGDLRASIRGERFNLGFANYQAIVGPTIIYGRQVELGGGNWPSGVRFPYMEPAYRTFLTSVLPQVQRKYFRRVFR